jgi:23S rRNA (adenine2030-N6)-methyltransferase
VLKHAVLVAVLRHMNLKDKGWRLVDTHAGAGAYDFTHGHALRHAEFENGIGRLWEAPDLPPLLADYVAQVAVAQHRLAPSGAVRAGPEAQEAGSSPTRPPLTRYPGSPELVRSLMRPQDQLRLHELHPTDHESLARRFAGDRAVQVLRSDGFAGLKAHLPPPTRRGVLLIDPSYELKRDYPATLDAVKDALTRFAECVVLVWIPLIADREAQALPQRLARVAQAQGKRGSLHAQLTVAPPNDRGFGLLGSSMLIINPPHTLQEQLAAALPVLAERLGQFAGADHRLQADQV